MLRPAAGSSYERRHFRTSPVDRAGSQHTSLRGRRSKPYAAAAPTPPDASSAPSTSAPSASDGDCWALLKEFTKREFRGASGDLVATPEKREALRTAVLTAYRAPHPPAGWGGPGPDADVLLGVTASSARFAARAFRDWCAALDLPYVSPESRVPGASGLSSIQGAVYIKYNARSRQCYAARYVGRDRGVLLQLGQEQLGHFPLGMFDEEMKNPEPVI